MGGGCDPSVAARFRIPRTPPSLLLLPLFLLFFVLFFLFLRFLSSDTTRRRRHDDDTTATATAPRVVRVRVASSGAERRCGICSTHHHVALGRVAEREQVEEDGVEEHDRRAEQRAWRR